MGIAVRVRAGAAEVREVQAARRGGAADRRDQVLGRRVRRLAAAHVRRVLHTRARADEGREPRRRGHVECVVFVLFDFFFMLEILLMDVVVECPLCQEDHAEFYCMECKLVFCETCASRVHSVARVRNHRRFPIEGRIFFFLLLREFGT